MLCWKKQPAAVQMLSSIDGCQSVSDCSVAREIVLLHSCSRVEMKAASTLGKFIYALHNLISHTVFSITSKFHADLLFTGVKLSSFLKVVSLNISIYRQTDEQTQERGCALENGRTKQFLCEVSAAICNQWHSMSH